MQKIIEWVRELFAAYSSETIERLEKLPQSGSDRNYFRITTPTRTSIATYNHNVNENNTFVSFSAHFRSCDCPVPDIFAINEEQTIYLQEDFGDESLLSKLEQHGYNEYVFGLFQQSLRELARLQITGGADVDYSL